jgi:hypothetical protein
MLLAKQHPGHLQGLRDIQAENFSFVHLPVDGPDVIVLLRTEEVHDVSGAARPVLEFI